jgi:Flp pilus assembly protein TadD
LDYFDFLEAELGALMEDAITKDIRATDIERVIAQGGIRKALGLRPLDLRLGLDFARTQLQRGAVREALRTYVALVLCDPSDPELQVGLANCALHVRENDLALQAASVVIVLAPSDPRGYYLSGRACFALGYRAEAVEDLTKSLELAESSGNALITGEAKKLLAVLTDRP